MSEEMKSILEETEILWNDRKRLEQLEKENEELKKQIEKMKCCENCLFFDGCSHCDLVMVCKNYDKWELAE